MEALAPPRDIEPAPIDTSRRFVRVTHERDSGFVEFDFAIGEPELFVEMILAREAFAAFCAEQRVEPFPPAPAQTEPPGDFDWRLGDATGTRIR
ncbi:phenol hydroxylase subunit [Xanthobacter autotrophicus]|uniref:phenol hydroxylase subunit n=1 Tax=Xanthobacter TaxID=279 RepID=UPI0024AA7332|nr:phenol hydroxylase subunit [Xanthobacter autotrophicus]MDI4665626.1 phenol hydroxylase subunit [Xanthobacter autotrophicus]